MRTTSNIVFDLGRVLGLSRPSGEGVEIEVPSRIQPCIDLSGPIDSFGTPPSGNIVANSFHIRTSMSVVAASGAITSDLLTMSKGLWRFNILGGSTSNYQGTTAFDHEVVLQDAAANVLALMGFQAAGASAAPVGQALCRTLDILLPVDGTIIHRFADNNAAGQSMTTAFDIVGIRLL